MKTLLFALLLGGSYFVTTPTPNIECTGETTGPSSVIISGGQATYFNDGAQCTINLDNGTSYGKDCGRNIQ